MAVTIIYSCDGCGERLPALDRHQLVCKVGADRFARPSTDLCPLCWEATKELWDSTASPGTVQPTPRKPVRTASHLPTCP